MKRNILCIVLFSFSLFTTGQVYEVGITLGGSNYVGDIGSTNYINPNKLAGSILFKYNYNPRIAVRGTLSYLPIAGDDQNSDTSFRKNRGLSFSNILKEAAFGIEYNFYEFYMNSDEKNWTPYLLIEIAAINYSAVTRQNNLGNDILENKTSLVLPFGIGIKSKLVGNLGISLETKFRYTFGDDLDFVSKKDTNFNIEGNSSDWYMFTGVSLIYTFGRPACYTEGL